MQTQKYWKVLTGTSVCDNIIYMNDKKNAAAVELGKKSAAKRGLNDMTKEQRSDYMKKVRASESPIVLQDVSNSTN